jgi:hypothetical protein
MQWQILTKDPSASSAFYAGVFGWTVSDDNALGYRTVSTGSDAGIDGGFWPAPSEGHQAVQLFIQVDDVPSYCERAVSGGAQIIIPPQKLPDGDEMAILIDPLGIPFGLVKGKG